MTYLINTAPILGTVSSDVLGGSVGADFIVGLDGNDQISGALAMTFSTETLSP